MIVLAARRYRFPLYSLPVPSNIGIRILQEQVRTVRSACSWPTRLSSHQRGFASINTAVVLHVYSPTSASPAWLLDSAMSLLISRRGFLNSSDHAGLWLCLIIQCTALWPTTSVRTHVAYNFWLMSKDPRFLYAILRFNRCYKQCPPPFDVRNIQRHSWVSS